MSRRQRPGWQQYFLNIAKAISVRSTCPRAQVGAVIVKDGRIISCGYNGAVAGEPHCTEAGCLVKDGHCQRAVHAETNAIAQAARFGVSVEGATLYYWDSLQRPVHEVCVKCSQLIKAAGITKVIYNEK
jgi:dCMP deaminase